MELSSDVGKAGTGSGKGGGALDLDSDSRRDARRNKLRCGVSSTVAAIVLDFDERATTTLQLCPSSTVLLRWTAVRAVRAATSQTNELYHTELSSPISSVLPAYQTGKIKETGVASDV